MSEQTKEKMKEQSFEDEIDLLVLFKAIWEKRIFIFISTSIISLASIIYALSLTNYYTSQSILNIRDSQDSSMVNNSFGLTSMVGLNLFGETNKDASEIIELIQSREFVKRLIRFEDVLPSLLAIESYDSFSKKLIFDSDVYDSKSKKWVRNVSQNQLSKPSYLEAHRAYSEMLDISIDKVSGLISLEFEHVSPIFAQKILSLIIQEANNFNREMDIKNTNLALSHFEKELSKTSLLEMKESINQLIETQLETRMMASIYDDYVLVSIEPPFVPDRRSKPSRSFIVIFSTLIGGLMSLLYVVIRHYFLELKNS
tara:strand:- start:2294 stop:3232 length:939 start_codon:yes stop_codon:yes gene_type:complete